MKLTIILCAVSAALSAADRPVFKIPPESLHKMHSIALPCAQQYNVDTSVIRKIGDASFPPDESSSKFLFCYSVNSGLIREDGHLVVDRIIGIVGDHPIKDELREALKNCNEIIKEDPIATLLAIRSCYAEKSPLLFAF